MVVSNDDLDRARRLLAITRRLELALAVVTFVLMAMVTVVTLVNVAQTHRTIEKIDSCTIPGGVCYANLLRSGQSGRQALIDYFSCALLIQPAERTKAKLDDCTVRALTPPPIKKGTP